MNEKQLDELLEQKKNIPITFFKSESRFSNDFFAAIETRPRRSVFHWRYAAGFVLLLGIAAIFSLSLLKNPYSTNDKYRKISEAVRLFGGDAAVLFFGNNLITGERESTAKPVNLVEVLMVSGNKKFDLSLACSDYDSLYLDTAEFSGSVVVSRCDASTLVLDVELNINGETVRTVFPVTRRNGNKYEADVIS